MEQGKQIYKKEFKSDLEATFWIISFCISLIFMITVIVIGNLLGFNNSHPLEAIEIRLLFNGSIIGLIIKLSIEIKNIYNSFRYAVYENGFIYIKKISGRKNKYIDYSEIKSIIFESYGLRLKIILSDGTVFTISNGDGEKPFLLIIQTLIGRFNLQDYPDYSTLQNWDNYKTKEEKKEALLTHFQKNKNFI